MRCASTEQSRGIQGYPPPKNFEFYIARDVIIYISTKREEFKALWQDYEGPDEVKWTRLLQACNVWGRSWGV